MCTRALGRRPYFEVDEDYRFFGEKLSDVVEESRIEVHAFCFMTNHVHMLVKSLDGQLSDTMRDVLGPYTRWFNKRRDRDGPLVKSRFFSRIVDGQFDRFIVTRYIDQNPVKANLARSVIDYRHGSARHIAFGTGPEWLTRSEIETIVCWWTETERCDPRGYVRTFDGLSSESAIWLVESRLRDGADPAGVLGRLLGAPATAIQDWMQETATMADGHRIGCALAPPGAIVRGVDRLRRSNPHWTVQVRGRHREPWTALTAGLLQVGSFCTSQSISQHVGTSPSTIARRLRDHRSLMATVPEYAAHAAHVLHTELRNLLPGK